MKRITTERDYEEALSKIEALMDTPEDERDNALMERLTDMVMAYEEKHYAIEPPPVAAALQFRMEQEGLTQADVSRISGIHKSKISEILSGTREPSKEHIKVLHNRLGIPLHHLLGDAGDWGDVEIDSSMITGYPDLSSHDLRTDFKNFWGDDDCDACWRSSEKVLAEAA